MAGAAGSIGALLLAACASSATSVDRAAGARPSGSPGVTAAELTAYVHEIEAIRLPVDDLLEQADPILDGAHDKTVTPAVASQRMSALEQRFAGYLVAVNAIVPANAVLAELHAPYAHTYFYAGYESTSGTPFPQFFGAGELVSGAPEPGLVGLLGNNLYAFGTIPV